MSLKLLHLWFRAGLPTETWNSAVDLQHDSQALEYAAADNLIIIGYDRVQNTSGEYKKLEISLACRSNLTITFFIILGYQTIQLCGQCGVRPHEEIHSKFKTQQPLSNCPAGQLLSEPRSSYVFIQVGGQRTKLDRFFNLLEKPIFILTSCD